MDGEKGKEVRPKMLLGRRMIFEETRQQTSQLTLKKRGGNSEQTQGEGGV